MCMDGYDIPRLEAPIVSEPTDDELQDFSEAAFEAIIEMLQQNRRDAESYTDVDKSVDDVLATHNTRSFDIRAEPLENPRVTLWLKDCPVWANDATRTTIRPNGLNDYNGKVTVTIDVRPF